MAGSKNGGLKAAKTNKERYGEDWYKKIGKIGGSRCGTEGGFASKKVGEDGLTGPQRAREAGKIGGKVSKRGPAKKKKEENVQEKED